MYGCCTSTFHIWTWSQISEQTAPDPDQIVTSFAHPRNSRKREEGRGKREKGKGYGLVNLWTYELMNLWMKEGRKERRPRQHQLLRDKEEDRVWTAEPQIIFGHPPLFYFFSLLPLPRAYSTVQYSTVQYIHPSIHPSIPSIPIHSIPPHPINFILDLDVVWSIRPPIFLIFFSLSA